jgi:pre-mRNA-processing factor 19
LVLLGGNNGVAGVYSASQNEIVQEMEVGSGAVTAAVWAGTRAVVSTSSGVIKVFEGQSEVASFSGHAGKVTALAMHPSGDILASVGVDKSYILYDLTSYKQATQIYTDAGEAKTAYIHLRFADSPPDLTCAGFHPDGHLFAAGGSDGQIKVFDVKSGTNAANFDGNGAIQALAFSENGTWLAVVVKGSTSVSIWDLRKSAQLKVLDIGSPIASVVWDYTGQFLVVAGPSGLSVQQYSKSTKDWSEPLRSAIPAVAVAWGAQAQSLISLSAEGIITLLGLR